VKLLIAAALALLMCAGCASRNKEPTTCEDVHLRCARLCEYAEDKGFHGPVHLPPPITKPGPSCHEACTDEMRSCRSAREAAKT
jgi:hypothetical protein